MEVFKDIFNDWVGLLSLGTIVFILLIAVYFIYMFLGKSARHE